mgnify:CR=1 FL=1
MEPEGLNLAGQSTALWPTFIRQRVRSTEAGERIAHVGGDKKDAPIKVMDKTEMARRVAFILGRAVG